MFVVQHAGGGKANQYFLRGFDADHGTDVALSVDGVPVNLVSHGHGQGYADLHWVIPELVERIEVHKGPYWAKAGDFATAGAINLVMRRSFETNQISLGAGTFDTYRALLVASPKLEGFTPLMAAEVYGTDGPFEHGEDLKRYNLHAKVTRDFDGAARSSLSVAATSYGGGWNASGQIPLREVRSGRLDRFGSIDPSEGGSSQRHGAYAVYRAYPTAESAVSLLAHLSHYRLNLFSNFTFFSADPVNGDMIEQVDARTVSGFSGNYRFVRRASGVTLDTTFGVQARNDLIENGLHRARRRERLGTTIDDVVREGSLGAYGEEIVTLTRWLRAVVGLRADYFGFQVEDRREDVEELGNPTSGVRQAALVSPKASLILAPAPELEVYANFGRGFHSNDARGVVQAAAPVTPLTPATGYEGGMRSRLLDTLDLAAAVFLLDLDSETVWVGDEGTTEASRRSRRFGAEFEARAEITSWLHADADVSLTRATFTEFPPGENAVPLAPSRTVSLGLSVQDLYGLFGRLGVFHIGDRPATEDRFLVAEGFTRLDATIGYRHRPFEISVAAQNLTNTRWREAQFATVSRLPHETSSASCPSGTRPVTEGATFRGCEDVSFTPGSPINVQAVATLFF
jgi:outer membrane receptor protein involved in Fe transport